jgi:hypothetical protein
MIDIIKKIIIFLLLLALIIFTVLFIIKLIKNNSQENMRGPEVAEAAKAAWDLGLKGMEKGGNFLKGVWGSIPNKAPEGGFLDKYVLGLVKKTSQPGDSIKARSGNPYGDVEMGGLSQPLLGSDGLEAQIGKGNAYPSLNKPDETKLERMRQYVKNGDLNLFVRAYFDKEAIKFPKITGGVSVRRGEEEGDFPPLKIVDTQRKNADTLNYNVYGGQLQSINELIKQYTGEMIDTEKRINDFIMGDSFRSIYGDSVEDALKERIGDKIKLREGIEKVITELIGHRERLRSSLKDISQPGNESLIEVLKDIYGGTNQRELENNIRSTLIDLSRRIELAETRNQNLAEEISKNLSIESTRLKTIGDMYNRDTYNRDKAALSRIQLTLEKLISSAGSIKEVKAPGKDTEYLIGNKLKISHIDNVSKIQNLMETLGRFQTEDSPFIGKYENIAIHEDTLLRILQSSDINTLNLQIIDYEPKYDFERMKTHRNFFLPTKSLGFIFDVPTDPNEKKIYGQDKIEDYLDKLGAIGNKKLREKIYILPTTTTGYSIEGKDVGKLLERLEPEPLKVSVPVKIVTFFSLWFIRSYGALQIRKDFRDTLTRMTTLPTLKSDIQAAGGIIKFIGSKFKSPFTESPAYVALSVVAPLFTYTLYNLYVRDQSIPFFLKTKWKYLPVPNPRRFVYNFMYSFAPIELGAFIWYSLWGLKKDQLGDQERANNFGVDFLYGSENFLCYLIGRPFPSVFEGFIGQTIMKAYYTKSLSFLNTTFNLLQSIINMCKGKECETKDTRSTWEKIKDSFNMEKFKNFMYTVWDTVKGITITFFKLFAGIMFFIWEVLKSIIEGFKVSFSLETEGHVIADFLKGIGKLITSIFVALWSMASKILPTSLEFTKAIGKYIIKSIFTDAPFILFWLCQTGFTLVNKMQVIPFQNFPYHIYEKCSSYFDSTCPANFTCNDAYCIPTEKIPVVPIPVRSINDTKENFSTDTKENFSNGTKDNFSNDTKDNFSNDIFEYISKFEEFEKFIIENGSKMSFEEFESEINNKFSDTKPLFTVENFAGLTAAALMELIPKIVVFITEVNLFIGYSYFIWNIINSVMGKYKNEEVPQYDILKQILVIITTEDSVNKINKEYENTQTEFTEDYRDLKLTLMKNGNKVNSLSYENGGDPYLLCSNNYNIENDTTTSIKCGSSEYTYVDTQCDYDSGCYQVGICENPENANKIACKCPPVVNMWSDNLDNNNLNGFYLNESRCRNTPGCYKVGEIDNFNICGCCPRVSNTLNTGDIKVTSRETLTTWLENKIETLKNQLDIIITSKTGWNNNSIDNLRVRTFDIYLSIMELIIKLYQELFVVSDTKTGKPWDNFDSIIEMNNFISNYLPFIKIQVENLHFIYLNNLYWIGVRTENITTHIVGRTQLTENNMIECPEGYVYDYFYDPDPDPSSRGPVYTNGLAYFRKAIEPELLNNKFDYLVYLNNKNKVGNYVNLFYIFEAIEKFVAEFHKYPRQRIINIETIAGLDPNNFAWPNNKITLSDQLSSYGMYRNMYRYNNADYSYYIPGASVPEDITSVIPYPFGKYYSNWENMCTYGGNSHITNIKNTPIIITDNYITLNETPNTYNLVNLRLATDILGPDAFEYYILPTTIETGRYYIQALDNPDFYLEDVNSNIQCSYVDNFITLTPSTNKKLLTIYKNNDNSYYIQNLEGKYLYCSGINEESGIVKLYYKNYIDLFRDDYKFLLDNKNTSDGSVVIKIKKYNLTIVTIKKSQQFICSNNTSYENYDGMVLPTDIGSDIVYSLSSVNMRYNLIPEDISSQFVVKSNIIYNVTTIQSLDFNKQIGDHNSTQLFYIEPYSTSLSFENIPGINSGDKAIRPLTILPVQSWTSTESTSLPPIFVYANSYTNINICDKPSYNIYGRRIRGRWIRIGFLDNVETPRSFKLTQVIIFGDKNEIIIDSDKISSNSTEINFNDNKNKFFDSVRDMLVEEEPTVTIDNNTIPIQTPALDHINSTSGEKLETLFNGIYKTDNYVEIRGINPYILFDLDVNTEISFVAFVSYSPSIDGIQIEIIHDYYEGLKNLRQETGLDLEQLSSSQCSDEQLQFPDNKEIQSLYEYDNDLFNFYENKFKKVDKTQSFFNDRLNTVVFLTDPIKDTYKTFHLFNMYSKSCTLYENNTNPISTGLVYPDSTILGKTITFSKPDKVKSILLYDENYKLLHNIDTNIQETNNFSERNKKISNIIIVTLQDDNAIGGAIIQVKNENGTITYNNTLEYTDNTFTYTFNYYNNKLPYVHKVPVFDKTKVPRQHLCKISRYIYAGLMTYIDAITDIKIVKQSDIERYTNQGYKTLLPDSLLTNESKSNEYNKPTSVVLKGELYNNNAFVPTPKFLYWNILVKYTRITENNLEDVDVITNIEYANPSNEEIHLYQISSEPTPIPPKFSIMKKRFTHLTEGDQFLVSGCYLTKTTQQSTSKLSSVFNLDIGSGGVNTKLLNNNLPMYGKDIIFEKMSISDRFKKGMTGIGLCYNIFTRILFYNILDSEYVDSTYESGMCSVENNLI